MIKRSFDIALLVACGAVLAIPALLTVVLVRATSQGPALHWSDRIGRGGRIFRMPKFRTMHVGTPQVATDKLAYPKSRLTPVGGILRKLSLDEIPQLWSVAKGDMSLVGPRPALHNQHELIAARKAAGIDALRPGITGWAQVNGRDDLSDERKLAFDREYLDRAGVGFDLRILALTVLRVARRHGVAH